MKQLKFNIPKILQSLLNKTKTTTIRKAWRIMTENFNRPGPLIEEKPAKYKVGEILEVVWTGDMNLLKGVIWHSKYAEMDGKVGILGKVKITKIEKIEIFKDEVLFIHPLMGNRRSWSKYGGAVKMLSESEGFKSVNEMFLALSKYAPEIKKRVMPFILYSFQWVE